LISRTYLAASAALALAMAGSAGAKTDHASPDRAVFGWVLGLPVYLFARAPARIGGEGPDSPSPDVPDVTVYLIAPINDTSPHGPPVPDIVTAHGRGALPPHMDVLDRHILEANPHDAIGVFVVPGPKASAANVRTRPAPPNSLAGAPMAYEIKIGDVWAPLTSHAVIQYGIEAGLLATKDFDYGGLMWSEWPDEQAQRGGFTASAIVTGGAQ
jgi:hypothetical protein